MKLCEQIKLELDHQYDTVFVKDERGDGHFVQVVCIDPQFEGENAVFRSRKLYRAVEAWQEKVHAWSVKAFTPDEWEQQKNTFEYQAYKHYPKH